MPNNARSRDKTSSKRPAVVYEAGFGTKWQTLVRRTGPEGVDFVLATHQQPPCDAARILPLTDDARPARFVPIGPATDGAFILLQDSSSIGEASFALVDSQNLFPRSSHLWNVHQITHHIQNTLELAVKVCDSVELPDSMKVERLLFWLSAVRHHHTQQQREWRHGTAHYDAIQQLASLRIALRKAVDVAGSVRVSSGGPTTRWIQQTQSDARALAAYLAQPRAELRRLVKAAELSTLVGRLESELSREPESRRSTNKRAAVSRARIAAGKKAGESHTKAKNDKKRDAATAIVQCWRELTAEGKEPNRKQVLKRAAKRLNIGDRTLRDYFRAAEMNELFAQAMSGKQSE